MFKHFYETWMNWKVIMGFYMFIALVFKLQVMNQNVGCQGFVENNNNHQTTKKL